MHNLIEYVATKVAKVYHKNLTFLIKPIINAFNKQILILRHIVWLIFDMEFII